jgi:predicted lactoylglutathione lyase
MAGIIFFKTQQLDLLRSFYVDQIGMEVWLEQADCVILRSGNMLVGFCQRDQTDTCGMITFFYKTREEVDQMYEKFKECSLQPPRKNDKYRIYHCFVQDPDGRSVEFQQFLHPTPSI